ncbi:uracil DNA N-glycosylase Thp1 [Coemansia spiralis]|uniref:Uracil DNA N-glycosylase Thp1 n=2 Tax=Coemansia TaxID=4863 RepID=A0A9W8G2I7_9FUNG|nr:uracil DNA N-glycosylase Thp1 [Coemansia umbellata]KAJ2625047.1 uracil DNA N-glycosylase Thp1 [Coemansia sp. RSA 1358]KAJ2669083.1 uracil DNA N-glycosylase Thp1 [Coemansia spiralis]
MPKHNIISTRSSRSNCIDRAAAVATESLASASLKKTKRPKPSSEEIAMFPPIPEVLRPNLDVLFVGINPGVISGQKQLHFGNPQNYFWRGLYQSGLIPEEIQPEDGHMLQEKWNMSIVNLVQRTTPSASDLSRKEMRDAVPELCRKISSNPPKIVCFVGKGIFEAFVKGAKFELGLQPEVYDLDLSTGNKHDKQPPSISPEAPLLDEPPLRLPDPNGMVQCALPAASSSYSSQNAQPLNPSFAYLFVLPSTSGRAATYSVSDKLQYMKQLKYVRDCAISAACSGTAPAIDHSYLDSLNPRKVTSKYFSER